MTAPDLVCRVSEEPLPKVRRPHMAICGRSTAASQALPRPHRSADLADGAAESPISYSADIGNRPGTAWDPATLKGTRHRGALGAKRQDPNPGPLRVHRDQGAPFKILAHLLDHMQHHRPDHRRCEDI